MNCYLKNDAGQYVYTVKDQIIQVTSRRWKAKVYKLWIEDNTILCDPPPPAGTWYPESL